ncbi:Meiotically up-regulated protein [Apiospora saccharicola]
MMPGGVCAVLDYEVEIMAEYVAEMAMRVVLPETPVTVAFRKFVSQILTSTRLPSTTILLGMNYLAKRVNTLKHLGRTFKPNEGEVWRLLTVSLLLGSKFLDDNTFQNRSWSEVSGIPVQELNRMENEWLVHMNWSLYVNLDESGDYNAWLSSWKEWRATKEREQMAHHHLSQVAAREQRLGPLVTSMRPDPRIRNHSIGYEGWTPEESNEFERLQQTRNKFRPRENSWQGQYQNTWPTDPLTPPDSGYGTPEYLNSAASLNSRYNDWFGSAVSAGYTNNRNYHGSNMSHHHGAFGNRASHYQQPFFGHYGGHGAWDSSPDCNCNQCMSSAQKPAHYFHHNPYGQPVIG